MRIYITFLILTAMLFISGTCLSAYNISDKNINNSLYFIENRGQWGNGISYAAKINCLNFIVESDGIVYDIYTDNLKNPDLVERSGQVIKMVFLNPQANIMASGSGQMGYLNYFVGNNQEDWISDINTFKKIRISNIFNNVDMVLLFDNGNPRYDFIIKANTDPSVIKFKFDGANKIFVDNEKGLVLETRFGEFYNGKIYSYQEINGKKIQVECRFSYDNGVIGFSVGNYDKSKELIIDPVVFSSYFGGVASDEITDIKYDKNGEFIICGSTESTDFHTTVGSYDLTLNGKKDAFIARFKVDGSFSQMKYSTLIGARDNDVAAGLDLDNEGNVYLTGSTSSMDFPVVNPYSNSSRGGLDGFVSKISSDGKILLFSTYLGGSKDDIPHAIKINSLGNAFIIGETKSKDFPTQNSFQNANAGATDIFISKLSPSGLSLLFSSYIGGSGDDRAFALDIDNKDELFITGETNSGNFPIAPFLEYSGRVYEKPYDYTYNGGYDAFLIEISGEGGKLDVSSYFGGTSDDRGTAIVAGKDGTVLIAGQTNKESGNKTFPTTEGAFQSVNSGAYDCFIAKLDKIKKGTYFGKDQALLFSTLFGGNSNDCVMGMLVNELSNKLILMGYTNSSTFPSVGDDKNKINGGIDGFITEFSIDGGSISSSFFIGGKGDEKVNSVCIDEFGNIYFGGTTSSNNLIAGDITVFNKYFGGTSDGFLGKVVDAKLEVNYPAGNERYCPGTVAKIGWKPIGLPDKDIYNVEAARKSDMIWQVIGSNIQGENFDWLIPENQPGGSDYIIRIVHKSALSTISPNSFTIYESPKLISIESEPSDLIVCENSHVRFVAKSTGTYIKYQWRLGGKEIKDANDSIFNIESVKLSDAGSYDVVISGTCNPKITGKELKLNIIPETKIINQSTNINSELNKESKLFVTAVGSKNEYNWYKDDMMLMGMTDSTLILNRLSYQDAGVYYCTVKGECGATKSEKIRLSVLAPTDVKDNIIESSKIMTIRDILISEHYIAMKIRSNIDDMINLKIYDSYGNNIKSYDLRLHSGENSFDYSIQNITNGIYWVVLNYQNNIEMKKFLVSF